MSFSELNLKAKYDSDEDDILHGFHIKLLAKADGYDRAVGYFSSEVLSYAASGLEKFILSDGKMRLIIGDPLTDEEYEAVMEGVSNPAVERSSQLSELLLHSDNSKLRLLTYLIANKQLEIKFAFTHKGMFHKKIGIFYKDNETVVFSGSANETLAGLSKYNSEEISVFFSWKDSFNDYGQIEVDNFNDLWNNNKKRTLVIPLNSDAYHKIQSGVNLNELRKEIFKKSKLDNGVFFNYSFAKSQQDLLKLNIETKLPRKPLLLKDRPFTLFTHQKIAIESWVKAGYKGLFKLATGSGKTFTSICALVDLYELRHKDKLPTFAIISVPYIELANQWVEELSTFNITPVKCYDSSHLWSGEIDKKILRFRNGTLDFLCVVVVNKTMSSELFKSKVNKISSDSVLFIGDECHHLGGESLSLSLPQCKYRLGLSATPFRNDEDEIEGSPFSDSVKENLLSYFNGIVSEYSLSDAIRDGILAPYKYDLVPAYLDDEEQEVYEELSSKILNLIIKAKGARLTSEEKLILTSLCGKRSRLLATCKSKLPALINYINSHPEISLSHSLIYVGEGYALDDDLSYILRVTNRLHENGCSVAKFTSRETSKERSQIMSDFLNKDVDSLVAMKVLDEGIDVPVCRSAFILASTRNPRQYVQRRGRVLRKSAGKTEALIVDFVVLPQLNNLSSASQSLRKAELNRINDFKLTALNPVEVEKRIIELGIF